MSRTGGSHGTLQTPHHGPFTASIAVPCPERHVHGVPQCVASSGWLLSLSIMHTDSPTSLHGLAVPSFLLLNSFHSWCKGGRISPLPALLGSCLRQLLRLPTIKNAQQEKRRQKCNDMYTSCVHGRYPGTLSSSPK